MGYNVTTRMEYERRSRRLVASLLLGSDTVYPLTTTLRGGMDGKELDCKDLNACIMSRLNIF